MKKLCNVAFSARNLKAIAIGVTCAMLPLSFSPFASASEIKESNQPAALNEASEEEIKEETPSLMANSDLEEENEDEAPKLAHQDTLNLPEGLTVACSDDDEHTHS